MKLKGYISSLYLTQGKFFNGQDFYDGAKELTPQCTLWFDGCNTCQAFDGVLTSCTELLCHKKEVPVCLTTIPKESEEDLKDCDVVYNGC